MLGAYGPMNQHLPRLAIFIDADNVGLQFVPEVLQRLGKSWDTSYRRAYGINLHANEVTLRENGVVPVEVLCNTPGKNSTDIALIIDAMEELCQGSCEAICIVSGDGDFTRLVQRVREKGKTAIVFGKSSSPIALRSACSEFYAIDHHQNSQKVSKAPPPTAAKAGETKTELNIRNGLRRVFKQFESECKPVSLDRFGEFLMQKHPELSPKKLGLRRLKPFLIRVGGFAIEPSPKGIGKTGMFRVTLPVKELSGISQGNTVVRTHPARIAKSDGQTGN
jgi:NYN domain